MRASPGAANCVIETGTRAMIRAPVRELPRPGRADSGKMEMFLLGLDTVIAPSWGDIGICDGKSASRAGDIGECSPV